MSPRISILLMASFGMLVATSVAPSQEPHRAKPAKETGEPKGKSAAPTIKTQTVVIRRPGEKLTCYFASPAGDKPAPGLIVIHEWWGLNDWVKRQADRFAEQGFAALAVDLYRGEVAKDAEHAHELMRGLADERAVTDLKSAFDFLAGYSATKGKPIGVIGWCMGGGFALKLAIAEPKLACTVVCYGKPVTDAEQLRRIKGTLLGIWGATDRGIEVEPFKEALDQAGVKHEHHVFPGAGHAFLNEANQRGYNKEQAAKAWGEIDRFLQSQLREDPRKP